MSEPGVGPLPLRLMPTVLGYADAIGALVLAVLAAVPPLLIRRRSLAAAPAA